MRTETAVLIVALLVTAGVAFVVLSPTYPPSTSTVTSTATSVSTATLYSYATTSTISGATTTVIAPNIELLADVWPSTIASGQNISIDMELYNPLPTNFTVVSDVWQPDGFGCPSSFPLGFSIYQGHYDFTSVQEATPLLLREPIPIPCFVGYNSTYTFDPHSDTVLDSNFMGQTRYPMNYTDVLSGYYFMSSSTTSPSHYTFQSFPPGSYTVLVFDRWGQEDIGYFEVT